MSSRTPKHKKTRTLRYRPLKVGISIGLVIVGALFIYTYVAPPIQSAALTRQLATETKRALAQHTTAADTEHQAILQRFTQANITYTSAYSATYNICYTDHNDSGWMINSYNVKCHIGYIDFLEVSAELLDKYQPEDTPSEYALHQLGSYDTLLGQISGVDSRHVQFFTPRLFNADAREILAEDDRLLTPSVTTYAITEAHNNRQKMSEAGSPTLDSSKRYVIVGYSYDYFSKNIGCATGSFLFCHSPLGKNPIEH